METKHLFRPHPSTIRHFITQSWYFLNATTHRCRICKYCFEHSRPLSIECAVCKDAIKFIPRCPQAIYNSQSSFWILRTVCNNTTQWIVNINRFFHIENKKKIRKKFTEGLTLLIYLLSLLFRLQSWPTMHSRLATLDCVPKRKFYHAWQTKRWRKHSSMERRHRCSIISIDWPNCM